MNNEGKILSILEKHDAQFEKINAVLETHSKLLFTLTTDVADLKTDVADLKQRVAEVAITQENVVLPGLQALAEGHRDILDKLAELTPKSRTEQLEEDMAIMKSAFRALSHEVAELKKAQ